MKRGEFILLLAPRLRGRLVHKRSSRVKYLGFRPRRWLGAASKMLTGRHVFGLFFAARLIACARCSDACAPTGAARAVSLFLSQLALGKIAELERTETPSQSVRSPLRASHALAPTHVGRKECLQCVTTV
jgi:hypothetical protein